MTHVLVMFMTYGPCVINLFNWMLTLELSVTSWLVVRIYKCHKKYTCYDEIGLHIKNIDITICSTINMFGSLPKQSLDVKEET
jgi:hypothetical protein